MKNSRIEILENTIKEAKKDLELASKMDRLRNNSDFIAVIEGELLDKYAKNTVYLLSDPNMQAEEQQADLIKDLEMIGRFRQFCSSIYQRANIAQKTIEDSNSVIEDLRYNGEDE